MEFSIPSYISLGSCFTLSCLYVSSLYVWSTTSDENRWVRAYAEEFKHPNVDLDASTTHFSDHPTTIKKRFFSISVVSLISPLFVYFFSSENVFKHSTLWEVLGLRWSGFLSALIFPLLLTMILFLGPLSLQLSNSIWKIYSGLKNNSNSNSNENEAETSRELSEPTGEFRLTFPEPKFWLHTCQNLLWLRNHVVAPLSEEFTFRACMMPLLLQSFTTTTSIFITPLFFGVGEFLSRIMAILEIFTQHF